MNSEPARPESPARVGGLVLCGGHSRRMGRSKHALPFGDETLLARAVRIVAEVTDPVVVVAAEDQDLPELGSGVLLARDRMPDAGPLAGLAAGLAALDGLAEAVFVTTCDAPMLRPEFITAMISELGSYALAIPRDGDYHHPLTAVYRVDVLATIEELLASGQRRPISLLEHVDAHEVDVERLRAVDPDLSSLRNINTLADYAGILSDAGLPTPPFATPSGPPTS